MRPRRVVLAVVGAAIVCLIAYAVWAYVENLMYL